MSTTARFRLAKVALALILVSFAATFALAPSLLHKPKPKEWPIDPVACGQTSGSGDCATKCSLFIVLGPKGDKTSKVELDLTWKSPGLRIVDHPPGGVTDTLGATPSPDWCTTFFSNPSVLIGALSEGCQPANADPRSSFTLLIANRSGTPRVVEIQALRAVEVDAR